MKDTICLGIESTAHTFGIGILTDKGKILANSMDSFKTKTGGLKNDTIRVGVKGMPFFVKKFEGGWTLKKISNSSTEAAFELKIVTKGIIGAIMEIPMKSKLTNGLTTLKDDLVTWVETGKVSSKKHHELMKKR